MFPEAAAAAAKYEIVSEEGEYSDSVYETVVMDTNGLCCLHHHPCGQQHCG